MAISVNKVYRTVLSIANKEQRGFITPDNIAKIGGQVQLSILEDNLVEYRNLINQRSAYRHADNYGDIVKLYREKIDSFLKEATITPSSGILTLPTDLYKVLNVFSSDKTTKYEEVDRGELSYLLSSPLTAPSVDFPIFYKNAANVGVTINPVTTSGLSLDYIKYPVTPRWGYTENANNGAYIHDTSTYVADGLAIGTEIPITTNISTAADGVYGVDATRSDSGTVQIRVEIFGGVATSVQPLTSGSGFQGDETLTVAATEFGITGASNPNLIATVGTSNIYANTTQGSIDFELHPSEEVRLVTDVLAYMGIVIRDDRLSAIAGNISQTKEIAKQS